MKLFSVCLLAATIAVPVSGQGTTPTTGSKPAAGAPAAGAGKPRTIEITSDDKMKYDKEEIVVKAGETIRIVLKAVGQMPKAIMSHNFVLLKPGVDAVEFNKAAFNARETGFIPPDKKGDVLAATALAGAGETVEVTFKAPAKPGSYNYLCSFPGHFAMGMRGKLVVK